MQAGSIFELQADLCAALGNSLRLQIIHLLKTEPLRVSTVSQNLGINQSTISRHLAILKRVGVLSATRYGTDVVYQIASPTVVNICDSMREALNEIETRRSEAMLSSDS